MEGLFNSPFMIKLQEFGQTLGRNKYLSALQAAMMSLMGVIMVGAIAQIITAVGSTMFNLFSADSEIYAILYTPYNYTMNMLALWIVVIMGFNYARNLEIKAPIISAVESLVAFLLIAGPLQVTEAGITVMDSTYLGAQGMFMGFVVVFVVVQIDRLCAEHNIYIKMPDIVPQFLQDGFAGIVPLLFNVIIFQTLATAVNIGTGGAYTVCSGFMALLAVPLAGLTSVPGMFILCLFAALLWCFGIHGAMVLVPIIMPLGIQAAMANAEAYATGGVAALVFYPIALFSGMSSAGGSGNTLPLVLMSLRSKSEQMRAVAKAGLIPGWFNINEPVTFGMPIMYNPVLCIPYVLSVVVNIFFWWIGYSTGIIIPAWISITALLPIGFAQYLSTLNPMNAVWDYLSLIPTGLVWYPFFKAYEKQLVAQEEEARKLEEAEAAQASA